MKKFLYMMLILALIMANTGCAKNAVNQLEQPPSRIGEGTIPASFENEYSFESALAAADVVARIEVENWIAEDTNLQKTYFEATVLQCFKGSIPTTFTLLQDGCSTGTLKGYPLFTRGNEMLVFLNEATEVNYDSPYWIIGSFMTILDVSYDDSGARYYADRYGILGETMNITANYGLQEDVFAEVYSKSVEADSIVEDMQYPYPYIFTESDLTSLIEDLQSI